MWEEAAVGWALGTEAVADEAASVAGVADHYQICEDVRPANAAKFENLPADPDLPGMGQIYCIPCARYFISTDVMNLHTRSKTHKQALRRLKEEPYTHDEAMRAAGMGPPDNGPSSSV